MCVFVHFCLFLLLCPLFYTQPLTKKMMNSGVPTNWNICNRTKTNVTAHFALLLYIFVFVDKYNTYSSYTSHCWIKEC